MKVKPFLVAFIGINLALVFLQVHKHSQFIKYLYALQKNEQTKELLVKKKQSLTHQLYACKNRSAIKDCAIAQLHMKPIQLRQIKKLDSLQHIVSPEASL